AYENTRDRTQALKDLKQNSSTYESLQRRYLRLAQNPPPGAVTVREGRNVGYHVKLQIWNGSVRRPVRLSGGGVGVTLWQNVDVESDKYAWVAAGQGVEAFNAWQTEAQVARKHAKRFPAVNPY